MNRRRFLIITAGLATLSVGAARAESPTDDLAVWRGVALGSGATLAIAAPDGQAPAHLAAARAEIARLEKVFSLYDAGSELSRLNAAGRLEAPSLDLVACLALAGDIHAATGGAFDPTVQPLWRAYAQSYAAGRRPDTATLTTARARVGWPRVASDTPRITLASGTELTLNGIAQGFIADRVAALLTARGLTNVLVDTGELRGLGQRSATTPWRATLPGGGSVDLRGRALATSAPRGTTFDATGQVSHILDPRTGAAADSPWRSVSISAPSAGLADGLSTAACLMATRGAIDAACARFDGARVEEALTA